MFWRNMLPPSSQSKSKPSNKLAEIGGKLGEPITEIVE
jgi:hypothetical protein